MVSRTTASPPMHDIRYAKTERGTSSQRFYLTRSHLGTRYGRVRWRTTSEESYEVTKRLSHL